MMTDIKAKNERRQFISTKARGTRKWEISGSHTTGNPGNVARFSPNTTTLLYVLTREVFFIEDLQPRG
jgi:hypothetical protein